MQGWVINETFYKRLLQDFSEQDIISGNFNSEDVQEPETSKESFKIAGVMNDFHYSSMHDRISNFAFAIRNPESSYNRWLIIRFQDGQYTKCLSIVKEMMDAYFPGRPNDGFLLSENLASRYVTSKKLSRIITMFTMLSIIIAVFGLYGLSAFVAQGRTKEIGIRKVFGASTRKILAMINLEFLILVAVSFALAYPATILAMNKWLQNFAYNSTPSVWIFILVGILFTAIVLLCVSWQTSNASKRNPADSLRHE